MIESGLLLPVAISIFVAVVIFKIVSAGGRPSGRRRPPLQGLSPQYPPSLHTGAPHLRCDRDPDDPLYPMMAAQLINDPLQDMLSHENSHTHHVHEISSRSDDSASPVSFDSSSPDSSGSSDSGGSISCDCTNSSN